MVSDMKWSLMAIQYAKSHGVPVSQLVRCENQELVDLSWHFFLASSEGRNVLVDCGTDEFFLRPNGARAKRWKIESSAGVLGAFVATGIRPNEVTDIVLTHAHWDHCDGVHHFPNATVHMNQFEWTQLLSFANEEQRLQLVELNNQSRLNLFSEARHILGNGFHLQEAGAHTTNHIVAQVSTSVGEYTIAGDAAYLYRNIELERPIVCTEDPERNLEDLTRLKAAVPQGHLIPGHDPEVFQRFRSKANVAIISE